MTEAVIHPTYHDGTTADGFHVFRCRLCEFEAQFGNGAIKPVNPGDPEAYHRGLWDWWRPLDFEALARELSNG